MTEKEHVSVSCDQFVTVELLNYPQLSGVLGEKNADGAS